MLFREVCDKLGDVMISGHGSRGPNPDKTAIAAFGAQFAEVDVDVETGIIQGEKQSVSGALRDGDREDASEATANHVILIRIEQGVRELPDPLLGYFPERNQCVVGNRIPRE